MKTARSDFIRFIKPLIPAVRDWSSYLKESYDTGYFANTGPAARAFERRLHEKYARKRATVTGPNATNSLVAALHALDVRGLVLTPSYTFPATAQAIVMAESTPVFCEISPDTWEMDLGVAERRIREGGITAILHVRPYGFGRDLTALQKLARDHGLPLIIDSASALGGAHSIDGPVGQQGDIEVFSLHATKVFAIGEGSVSVIRPDLETRLRAVSNFGLSYPDVMDRGLNSKLSDFQAAVGLAVLDRIDGYIAQRQLIANHYHATLRRARGVRDIPRPDLAPWQCYPVLLDKDKDVSKVIARALELDLELKRGYYKPLHQTSYYSRYADGALPVSEDISAHVVCLPVYSDMSLELADEVLKRFVEAIG
ncbi:MAG TPA: aminotransferase class I/II-fold pyridoxal phosphate-dependent enzyme [Gammaproteobacteria bacterium]|nr:aminotransferase class I/II-fold pyridoxal phosphate-dependent enzyme [Gammaproteobacteria bacterium]